MKNTINSYFATLIITLAGAGAAMTIIHVASSSTLAVTLGGSEAAYASFR
jgi:hypothetical protein